MAKSVTVTFEPLTQWPAGREKTPDWRREDAKFQRGSRKEWDGRYIGPERTPIGTTYGEMERELAGIDARNAVVQIDVRGNRRQLRAIDTYPLNDATVNSPAIVMSFTRKGVPYTFACDHFRRWQDNLRAIVLGLEGLRRLERYHIAQAGDQYRGWQALPATTTTALSIEAAAEALARRSDGFDADDILQVRDAARGAYRSAAYRVHPDRGGSTEDFQLVQEAKRVLEAHFGGGL